MARRRVLTLLNNNGEFILHKIYPVYYDWMLAKMSEAERNTVVTHFKFSLYNDFDISLEDIFYGLI